MILPPPSRPAPPRFRPVLRMAAGIAALSACAAPRPVPAHPSRPNIVVILADDLGYGDVRGYNPDRGKIPTPNLDRLAAEGIRFTDAHSSSGVCSPSRYALLTGRYHWRTRLQRGIVNLWEAPLIAPGRLTVAGLLRRSGYRTAAVGKWHLGWDWPFGEDERRFFGDGGRKPGVVTPEHVSAWREVFSRPIGGGPTTRGFDEYFGTDVPNWPPYAFIENDRTAGIPTEFLPASLLDPAARLASKPGPALPDWRLEAVLPALADRACGFIERSARGGEPFFLYLPLTSPHTPLAVNAEWRGRSGLGVYADFVMETDAAVGRVLDAIERSGQAGRTLVLLTSDNGCAPYIGVKELEARGHFPSGPLRGYKSDAWEGGHRVPFIVRWPGVAAPGGVCGRLVHQADLLATVAGILGETLPPDAGEDSVSLLPLLRGVDAPVREHAVSCSAAGAFAVRRGPWKLIVAPDGGPPSHPLYNLDDDLGEERDLAAARPDVAAGLAALLDRLIAGGRSTPGPTQANDVPVKAGRR